MTGSSATAAEVLVSWSFRPACIEDAAAVCAVVRSSITQLCAADHDHDPAILAAWLANKTPERVQDWIETNPGGVLVAAGSDGILGGAGAILPSAEIVLNYVAPWAQGRGAGRGMLRALEARASAMDRIACTLTSTVTARAFYRHHGYTDAGPPIASFGGKPAFPMCRALR